MAAVLRVKRQCDEEPQGAFVLACKRRKIGDGVSCQNSEITTILKFAGTVKTQNEDVTPHICKLKKDVKVRHAIDVSSKLRLRTKEASESNRYKVVNYFRQLQDSSFIGNIEVQEEQNGASQLQEEGKSILTVVDIVSTSNEVTEKDKCDEKEKSEVNRSNQKSKEDDQFVYDLYYGVTNDFITLDHLVDIHPLSSQILEFSSYRGLGDSDDSPQEEDEDDSNDENNWRNDYPDSDNSVSEDDMRLAVGMKQVYLDSGNELSDDEVDEQLLYNIPVDPLDIQRYGEYYANYKARMIRELADDSTSDGEEVFDVSSEDENAGDLDTEEDPAMRFM